MYTYKSPKRNMTGTIDKPRGHYYSEQLPFSCQYWMPLWGLRPAFWVLNLLMVHVHMGRVKRIWYLSPMRAAKVQASLRIRAVSPEPPLLAHTSSESRGTFRQKARSLAPLNGWACAVTICHDGMLEDTNSLDGAHIKVEESQCTGTDTIILHRIPNSGTKRKRKRSDTYIE